MLGQWSMETENTDLTLSDRFHFPKTDRYCGNKNGSVTIPWWEPRFLSTSCRLRKLWTRWTTIRWWSPLSRKCSWSGRTQVWHSRPIVLSVGLRSNSSQTRCSTRSGFQGSRLNMQHQGKTHTMTREKLVWWPYLIGTGSHPLNTITSDPSIEPYLFYRFVSHERWNRSKGVPGGGCWKPIW